MTSRSFKSRQKPFDPGPAAWDEILPSRTSYSTLDKAILADVVIVGGGFAGLSAARRLRQHDPNLKITLLEARQIAQGPAGRNSGFMIDLPHDLSSSNYSGKADQDLQRTAMNRRAIDFAGQCAAEFNMPTEAWVRSGKINAAATEKGSKHNHDYMAHLKALGEDCQLLDRRQMAEICGSDYYETGVFTPGTAMLQPALYVRELAKGLAEQDVSIYENSCVKYIEREGGSWTVSTDKGSVCAKNVLMTTNGHVESFGFFKRRLIHLYLFASMTRALTSDEEKQLGGHACWGFTPSDPLGSTVRKISGIGGTRLIIRNGVKWASGRTIGATAAEFLSKQHDQSFLARFPQLKDVSIEYRWGGLLCLSMNGVPAYGELEPGLISACCQNGLGTAFGTLSGIAAADETLGIKSDEMVFLNNHPEPVILPPEPLAGIGAKLNFWWGQKRAGAEL